MLKVTSVKCRRGIEGCRGSVKRSKVMTFNLKVMLTGKGRRIQTENGTLNLQSAFPGGIMLCVQNRKTVCLNTGSAMTRGVLMKCQGSLLPPAGFFSLFAYFQIFITCILWQKECLKWKGMCKSERHMQKLQHIYRHSYKTHNENIHFVLAIPRMKCP